MKASNLLLRLLLEGERETKKSSDIDAALKLVRFLKAGEKKDDKKPEKKSKLTPVQMTLAICAFGPFATLAYLAIIAKTMNYIYTTIPHP